MHGCAEARLAGDPASSTFILVVINLALVVVFAALMRRRDLLGHAKAGKWYITWLATGVITLMDELTSVFYAPAEAYRFIGSQAIFFIAFTSLLMRFLSSRMVEIGQILERNGIRGGGVYWFSYLALGPAVSFVAVASIMVDYILTACISSVSAVINGTTFLPVTSAIRELLIFAIVWGVAGLNILGIRENARVTFGIFIAAAVVFVNLIALGLIHIDPQSPGLIVDSARDVAHEVTQGGLAHGVQIMTVGVANVPFGVVVGLLGSIILIMAVNTAYVASSELIERVAHRYHFDWLTATNARASLYRIHLLNATLYSAIVLLTQGSQSLLAEMYAIGLLASFCINSGSGRWNWRTAE